MQSNTSTGGQLGLGDENDRWSPSRVEWLRVADSYAQAQQEGPGEDLMWRVLQVSCGLNHTAAVMQVAADVQLG